MIECRCGKPAQYGIRCEDCFAEDQDGGRILTDSHVDDLAAILAEKGLDKRPAGK